MTHPEHAPGGPDPARGPRWRGPDGAPFATVLRTLRRAPRCALAAVALTLVTPGLTGAQHAAGGLHGGAIKALSPEQIDDYVNGRGMGLAKAAELNHFPGPLHVIELADRLALTPAQKRRTEGIFAAMKAEAAALGAEIVERERELDRRFASGSVALDALATLLSELGSLQGRLRGVHLRAHVEQRSVLTPHQVRLYDALRGYRDASGAAHAGPHRHSH